MFAALLCAFGVFSVYSWRANRIDFVALVDAETGRTFAKLEPGWQLIGETATHAVVEKDTEQRSIKLPKTKDAPPEVTGNLFGLAWSLQPAEEISWWSRPQETTPSSSVSFARVDDGSVFLARESDRSKGCFSLSKLSSADGSPSWNVVSDFGKPADLPFFLPPTAPGLAPPPILLPGQNLPPQTIPGRFPIAPTPPGASNTNSARKPPPLPSTPEVTQRALAQAPISPPTTIAMGIAQAPDGSYPCPTLRKVALSETLVGVASDSRLMIFVRETGEQLGRAFDSPYGAREPQLLGELVVQQVAPTDEGPFNVARLVATDPRTGQVAWTKEVPKRIEEGPMQFVASNPPGNKPSVHIQTSQTLITLDEAGKELWRTPPAPPRKYDQPEYRGVLSVTQHAVVASTPDGFVGFDRLTGSQLWKRSIGGTRNAYVQSPSSNRTIAISFLRYRD